MSLGRIPLVALLSFVLFVSATDAAWAAANTITTLSAFASDSAMVLDAAGNPVVVYRDSLDTRLKILHCNDAFCSGGNESLATPDVQSGQWPSITLDAAGNPVVSYYTVPFDRIKLLHCDDPNCAGSEPVSTPDPESYLLNHSTSVALDAAGNPVIAYAPWAPLHEIRIMHCNDPDCTGNDESITIHDSLAAAPSLRLDAAGNPVVAYYRSPSQVFTTGTLRVMHCNDPDCAGGDEVMTSPDPNAGVTPSLQLDASGFPVIAYYTGSSTADLKIMHCNDANCAGSNETITTPDAAGDVGSQPSLALNGADPVVSYRDGDSGDLKILYCNDPACDQGNDQTTSLEKTLDSGGNSSAVIDASGLPAVSYDAGPDLHLVRCGDPDCAETVGGLAELPPAMAVEAGGFSYLWIGLVGAVTLAAAAAGGLMFRRLTAQR